MPDAVLSSDQLLSSQERIVIDHLVEAWNAFVELPVLHPSDREEFMRAIHQAQLLVMARPVQAQLRAP